MTFSTSFLNKALGLSLAALLGSLGCAAPREGAGTGPAPARKGTVAVLPVYNLSGSAAPLEEIRRSVEKDLRDRGAAVADDNRLERFMALHRLRYTGGINEENSAAIADELGVDSVLVTSLELYSPAAPPKIALNMRLVSAGKNPRILWMDSVGMAGDDKPGLLLLGLIEDPKVLTEKALRRLSSSLWSYLSSKAEPPNCPSGSKFRPRVFYRSPALKPGRKYTVAVLPYLNDSDRAHAGEILALEFVRQLAASGDFTVLEPGVVRDDLLKYRVILEGGVSIDTASVAFATLNSDLVLSGDVLDYEDYQGPFGTPKIGFSVLMIDRWDRSVVWESRSFGKGDEYVFFFDAGKINTTATLACRMARNVVEMMAAR